MTAQDPRGVLMSGDRFTVCISRAMARSNSDLGRPTSLWIPEDPTKVATASQFAALSDGEV
eukprot:3045898-Pyramimonas_sp.AAC.1